MSRRLPDLDSVTGVLASVAPPVDERAEREVVKNAVQDYDLDYGPRRDAELIGPGGNPIIQGRMQHVQALVAQNRAVSVKVPVSYGSAARPVRDHVTVSRVGDGIWVTGGTEAIKAMIMARNPLLQFGIAPGPLDAKVRVLTEEQAAAQYAARWGR